MDKIIIKNAKFKCNIGVTQMERIKKQTISADIELFSNLKKASRTDSIKDTISYSDVCKSIKKISEKKEYKLIETLAEEIAEEILSSYSVKKIVVRIKKPLQNIEYAAVEIARAKHG